jgi:Glycosyl transferases group 1
MSTVNECNLQVSAFQRPAGTADPLVVAMLYNSNGMATWCWEAAHALHEQGRKVLLIVERDTSLPGTAAVEVVRIDITAKPAQLRNGIAKAAWNAGSLLCANPDGWLQQIHICLAARGVQPAAYILNQSTLVDRSIPCAQVVAAWSYPVDLLSYLRKIPSLVPDKSSRAFLRTTLSAIGWWRKDWRAYRTADRVLPVTKVLLESLRHRSVTSDLAYPGTSVGAAPEQMGGGIKLLMAAANLGEPRKRVLWMLEAMKELHPPAGTILQLAGEPDDSIRRAAAQIGFPVEFLGHLQRQALERVMQGAHIFCFGSLLDDWGYVLVEAMANGLVPVAPAISPFDEILDGVGSCYNPASQRDFIRTLGSTISCSLGEVRRQAWNRANSLFSREAFGRSILLSLELVAKV